MIPPRQVVIIGAGHAGVQTAASLREEGFDGSIHLIDAQTALPYQRPPLSKAYLKGEATGDSIVLRAEQFYIDRRIGLLLGQKVERIERAEKKVILAGGQSLGYDRLVIATGARGRPLDIPGHDLANVFALRDMHDAEAIRVTVATAKSAVVIGAGFIGLEFAAVARALGVVVTVIEPQPRVMARAVSPLVSATFERLHRDLGTDLRLGAGVVAFHGRNGKVCSVALQDGSSLQADLVVVGIGVLAQDRLARQAGLALSNGIVVDEYLQTDDPAIFAAGDNSNHPNPFFEGRLRLESVQNAVDQAKCIARTIAGHPQPYRSVPWFWSDQGSLKLQIAGIARNITQQVVRGDPSSNAYSVFGFDHNKLKVVESINRPSDHMVARRLIGEGKSITPEQAADTAVDIKALAGGGTR